MSQRRDAETPRRTFQTRTGAWKAGERFPRIVMTDALSSTSHRPSNGARSQHATLMFPESQHLPARATKFTIRIPVSSHVSHDFLAPPFRVRFWPSPTLRASVPETSIDEDCNFRGRKGEICSAPCTRQRPIHAESQASRVNGRTNCQFAWRVSAQCDLHPTPGLKTRRLRSRRLVGVRPSFHPASCRPPRRRSFHASVCRAFKHLDRIPSPI